MRNILGEVIYYYSKLFCKIFFSICSVILGETKMRDKCGWKKKENDWNRSPLCHWTPLINISLLNRTIKTSLVLLKIKKYKGVKMYFILWNLKRSRTRLGSSLSNSTFLLGGCSSCKTKSTPSLQTKTGVWQY